MGNHVKGAQHFFIPDNFKFTTSQDLLLKLNKNIEEFKARVYEKLKMTKRNKLLIYCYGTVQEMEIIYQLSIIFALSKQQIIFLRLPGFALFEQTYPFLCSQYIKEQNVEVGNLDFIKIKKMNAMKNDDSLYGMIKSEDHLYPNSIICDRLYLGNAEHSNNLKVLQQLQITHILNATVKYPNAFESYFTYFQLAIDDKENESFESHWTKTMQFMEETLSDSKHRMFVHCEMGISRSATICIAYLMKKQKMTLFDAYFHCYDRRSIIRPNTSFLKQLEQYEKSLFNGQSTLKRVEQEVRQRYFEKLSGEQL